MLARVSPVMGVRTRVRELLDLIPRLLSRLGLVERDSATEAFDLAVPAMVTGGLRIFLRVADFLFVGLALGDAAIGGLQIGFQYYFIGFGLSLALTSGTISVVSRLKGEGRNERANLAVKQSLLLSTALAAPLTVVSWRYAEPMVALLTDDPAVIGYGSAYLRVVMLSLGFRFYSMVAARALAGSADTRTPMYVRLLTLPTNLLLNAVLVLGLGPFPALGVVGAAVGTAVANALASLIFIGLLVSGRYAVTLSATPPHVDTGLSWEVVRVAAPLAGVRLLQSTARFPFIFILAALGTPALAAYAIGRRVMLLALMPAWGYATAASTLVGQAIGAGDRGGADNYAWQTLRVGLATQVLLAVVLVVAARPLALAFGTEYVGLTVDFIRVFGLVTAAYSVSRTMRGSLRGAGDTRWPLYAELLGSYLVRIPVAALALPTAFSVSVAGVSIAPGLGLGYPAVFLAVVVDYYLKAAVNTGRFWSGEWWGVAQRANT